MNRMRFSIILTPTSNNEVIPINYQYPLSAAIYKVLAEADAEYATFLHEEGHKVDNGLKNFKLFTFSDLRARFKLTGDRMKLSSPAKVSVSFHLPETAQNFVKGLFKERQITLADKKSKATFLVEQITSLPSFNLPERLISTVCFGLSSMLICGKKNTKGNYEFLSPEHRDWDALMLHNWKEKCKAAKLQQTQIEQDSMCITPIFKIEKPKSRLIVVKANTKAQTRIKGYYGFEVVATGSKMALQLLQNAGCGVHNSLGCGFLEAVEIEKSTEYKTDAF
ncbi:CRISPR-associated endoribonuclease Cas6 [Arenibacter certesii]|nr:CRISPR-associated endoribonuclease Cas6 [Arenibacter certesii]